MVKVVKFMQEVWEKLENFENNFRLHVKNIDNKYK